jgi:hypothetical protein
MQRLELVMGECRLDNVRKVGRLGDPGSAPATTSPSNRSTTGWVNLVEVHYRTTRDHGRAEADQVLAELRPRIDEDLPGISAMREVSRLRAENPIALADCFTIALAGEEGAVLLTGDPEIIDRAQLLPCDVEDLRHGAVRNAR